MTSLPKETSRTPGTTDPSVCRKTKEGSDTGEGRSQESIVERKTTFYNPKGTPEGQREMYPMCTRESTEQWRDRSRWWCTITGWRTQKTCRKEGVEGLS